MDPQRNNLIALLNESDRKKLVLAGNVESLTVGDRLTIAGEPVSHIYFPLDGVVSIVAEFGDGGFIEMATVGREGFTGIVPLLGGRSASATHLVQMKGRAIVVNRQNFDALVSDSKTFQSLLNTYTLVFLHQVMVSVACNGRHRSEQRLARWLLMMRSRADKDRIELTQDFLADMLGVRRATISEAVNSLEQAGAIVNERGAISIVDNWLLEQHSCECYGLVEQIEAVLLGPNRLKN